MTTGNTTLLGLALPVEGELDGTWGDVVNDSITSLVDSAVAGTTTLSADADVTLTTTVLAANQARQAIILWTASNGATTRNITAPAQSKPYIVINAGTGSIVLRGAGPTTGITIVSGEKCLASWSGADFVKVASSAISNLTGTLPVANGGTGATDASGARTNFGATTLGANLFTVTNPSAVTFPRFNADNTVSSLDAADFRTAIGAGTGGGSVTSVGGTGTVNGITLTGTVTSSGNLTLGGTLSGVSLTTQITGTLPIANGGTGTTSTTFADLTTNVTGTLPVANGGTGATSLTANNVILGNGTSAVQVVAPGTAGNVLTSDGTTWTSAAGGGGVEVGALQYFAGPTTTTYPGSNWLLANGGIVSQAAYPTLFSTIGAVPDIAPVTWNAGVNVPAVNVNAITFGNGLYVIAGAGGSLATSTVGTSGYSAQTSGTTSSINALVYGNGLYVYAGFGGVLATSTDAITWTARTSGTTSTINALTYADGLYVVAGAGGMIRTSTDAITWTARTSGTTSVIAALIYGGLYVVAGAGGMIRTSTDAITWTARTSGTTTSISSLTYGNDLYVYGTGGGVLATSTDAITWTARTSGTTNTINSLTYNNGVYVYGGGAGTTARNIATSYNAVDWTQRVASASGGAIDVVGSGNGLYLAFDGTALLVSGGFSYNTATEFALPNPLVPVFNVAQVQPFIKAT